MRYHPLVRMNKIFHSFVCVAGISGIWGLGAGNEQSGALCMRAEHRQRCVGVHAPQSFAIALTERQRQAVVPRATRAGKTLETNGNFLESLPLGESEQRLRTGGGFERPRREARLNLQPVSQKAIPVNRIAVFLLL